MAIYCGPSDIWRRFMSGMPVTRENMLADDSLWWIRMTPKLHLLRMEVMMEALDRCNRATGYHSMPHRGCLLR